VTGTGDGRVAALVLTFAAPQAVTGCLDALSVQTRSPDVVIIVDNHSPEPVVVDRAGQGLAPVEVARLSVNAGPAGGHAAGLRRFLETGYEWAWVMDDDVRPAATALERLLVDATTLDGPGVIQPTMRDAASHEVVNTQGWCGVLVHRDVVRAVGVPDERLFWWTEDTEYLQWRVPRAGFPVRRSATAEVLVRRARPDATKPAWKYYYEARNQVHYRVRVQRPGPRRPVPHHLTRRVRWWRATRTAGRLLARSVLREHDHRTRKFAGVIRGCVDGLSGRLGPRVPVDAPHRPTGGEAA
jgi:GT2 family glycosyltransferase